MSGSTKELERRLKSIENTKKITKAMEMVSAAKRKKAVAQVSMTKTYAKEAWALAQTLTKRLGADSQHPLLSVRPLKRVAVVAISANRGLCGSFNREIINLTLKTVDSFKEKNIETDIITYGKKCGVALAARDKHIIADFKKEDVATGVTEVSALEKLLVDGFLDGTYDACYVIYTDYHSAVQQVPSRVQLLPFTPHPDVDLGGIEEVSTETGKVKSAIEESSFEPNVDAVLDYIIPRLIRVELYQAVLESNASEHSARMIAMKNAHEAADEMLDYLHLIYHRARQASITQEIAEISAGRIAAH